MFLLFLLFLHHLFLLFFSVFTLDFEFWQNHMPLQGVEGKSKRIEIELSQPHHLARLEIDCIY
jgi:hypothetical protein